MLCSTFKCLRRIDSSFDELHSIPWKWRLQDDAIPPWGDIRGCHVETTWTFDLDKDVLFFFKNGLRRKISLGLLRQRCVYETDLKLDVAERPPTMSLEHASPPSYWVSSRTSSERSRPFAIRILRDFVHQWSHVLLSDYNIHTFRRLARAIVRIATMDFHIVEVDTPQRGTDGRLVTVFQLPRWQPFDSDRLWVCGTRIILTQDIISTISLIQKDSASNSATADRKAPTRPITYLLLSVKHIALCRVDNNSLEFTQPEPFLNGSDPPSDMAIQLLLRAMQPNNPHTLLHRLPVEIQDMILRHNSAGSVEGARIGCVLDLGTPFLWKSGNRYLEREEVHRDITARTPMEQHIWFGHFHSGVVYK